MTAQYVAADSRYVKKIDAEQNGPAMQIDGVPDEIRWSEIADFINNRLGIDLNRVPRPHGVVIGWDTIECTVLAVNANGYYYLDRTGEQAAKHHIVIPVVHDETE